MCSRTLAALVGTMMLGGDLWFETFAVPWIADEVPGAFDTDPTVVLALGAVSSYLLMAIGWVLYGIASWRGRVFPRTLSASLVIGGVLAFNPPRSVRNRAGAGGRCGRGLVGPDWVTGNSRGRSRATGSHGSLP